MFERFGARSALCQDFVQFWHVDTHAGGAIERERAAGGFGRRAEIGKAAGLRLVGKELIGPILQAALPEQAPAEHLPHGEDVGPRAQCAGLGEGKVAAVHVIDRDPAKHGRQLVQRR